MEETHRIGMIGLDTSHVWIFADILNNPDHPHHVPGAKIAFGWPGGSPDFELSMSRIEGFCDRMQNEFGVELLETPEAVAEQSDSVFIMTIDGRVHLDLFKRVVSYGKPVFIDKPLATSFADAKEIMRLAREHDVPVMSCSSLRYADNLQAALADNGDGAITGCDVFGPMEIMPPLPGLYWYGIHSVEMLVAAMGAGCRQVHVAKTADTDIVVCEWEDGRIGVIRGTREQHKQFGLVLHREKKSAALDLQANERPYYAGLVDAISRSLLEGRSEIPEGQMLEVVRIIDAANESRESGQPVKITP